MNFTYKIYIVILIISVIILIDGYKYSCKTKFLLKKEWCTLYVELYKNEFPKVVMPRLMEADRQNLQYLYNQQNNNSNAVLKMNEYVENNFNQTNIARICSGFNIRYHFPTFFVFLSEPMQQIKGKFNSIKI
ncbi:Hypothetical protein SRAE_2000507010 [Strongyloides ratti]|uniref:Uncharacterized protein n=1 Tax=Strongyloides ratti TaxID=34506 RepID=A0A090MJV0_STRRB|nr:Hypothetical protein SRAE_2000507010 [Strongyloides ratti]CEG06149.1 Hypothetical protein SRAE_2000507010 [Strongyloides ratti]